MRLFITHEFVRIVCNRMKTFYCYQEIDLFILNRNDRFKYNKKGKLFYENEHLNDIFRIRITIC